MEDKAQKSILIGIPTLGNIQTETVSSLFSGSAATKYPAKLHIRTSSLVHDARNKIAQDAIDNGATHLLFVDSDIQFPREAINTLMERDLDIVGGLYYRKQYPHTPVIHQKNGKKLTIPFTYPDNKPFEVFAIGTGFLLIKVEVLKKLTPPYFGFGNLHGKPMGEDVFFCWKAHERGFKVWCDPTFKLGHVGGYVYTQEDFEANKQDAQPDVDNYWPEI